MGKTIRKNDGHNKGLSGHGVRNEAAIAAHFRKAGAMKDRREDRKGARNATRDYLSQVE